MNGILKFRKIILNFMKKSTNVRSIPLCENPFMVKYLCNTSGTHGTRKAWMPFTERPGAAWIPASAITRDGKGRIYRENFL